MSREELLKELAEEAKPKDLSRFNDPLAERIGWLPLRGGGSRSRTHRLVQAQPHVLEFRASWETKLFAAVFIVVGVGIMAAFLIAFIRGNSYNFPAIGFGLAFAAIEAAIYYYFAVPVVFDKGVGRYWRGRHRVDDGKHDLSAIHALQIVSRGISSHGGRFHENFKLKLVLKDGTRSNALGHGNLNSLRQNARALSQFLAVPVWDAAE